MVRWCIRPTRLTLVCEVIRCRLIQVRQNLKKKRLFGLAARNCHSLSLPLSFSSSSYFLSFSKQKSILPVSNRLMASTRGALKKNLHQQPRFLWLLVQIFFQRPLLLPSAWWAGACQKPRCKLTSSRTGLLTVGHLSPSPIGSWTQWTIEAAQVKVHHRPFSFEDGPVVYPTNAFDSVCEVIIHWYRLVQVRQNLKTKKKKDFSGWRPAIASLSLLLLSFSSSSYFLSFSKQKNKQTSVLFPQFSLISSVLLPKTIGNGIKRLCVRWLEVINIT